MSFSCYYINDKSLISCYRLGYFAGIWLIPEHTNEVWSGD